MYMYYLCPIKNQFKIFPEKVHAVPKRKLIGKRGQKRQKQKTLIHTSNASFFAPEIFICAFYLF